MITRELLTAHVERMRQQVTAYNGAIEFAEFLLTQIEPDGLPIQQLAEMVAGPGATATIEPVQTERG